MVPGARDLRVNGAACAAEKRVCELTKTKRPSPLTQPTSWAKDTSSAARMTNARSETAQTLPAFRHPMKLRSCLIPADGFYYSVLKKTLGGETHS
jgi:SOS response associated peptidase (SRAP)